MIMWIRSAFWIGTPKAGSEERFRELVDRVLVPAFRALPGVRDAKALWPEVREEHPPEIALQFLVEFDSRADVDRMLASDERRDVRPRVLEAIAMFDGKLSHIDYRVGTT